MPVTRQLGSPCPRVLTVRDTLVPHGSCCGHRSVWAGHHSHRYGHQSSGSVTLTAPRTRSLKAHWFYCPVLVHKTMPGVQ